MNEFSLSRFGLFAGYEVAPWFLHFPFSSRVRGSLKNEPADYAPAASISFPGQGIQSHLGNWVNSKRNPFAHLSSKGLNKNPDAK
jgi:hypothetical protein